MDYFRRRKRVQAKRLQKIYKIENTESLKNCSETFSSWLKALCRLSAGRTTIYHNCCVIVNPVRMMDTILPTQNMRHMDKVYLSAYPSPPPPPFLDNKPGGGGGGGGGLFHLKELFFH